MCDNFIFEKKTHNLFVDWLSENNNFQYYVVFSLILSIFANALMYYLGLFKFVYVD